MTVTFFPKNEINFDLIAAADCDIMIIQKDFMGGGQDHADRSL